MANRSSAARKRWTITAKTISWLYYCSTSTSVSVTVAGLDQLTPEALATAPPAEHPELSGDLLEHRVQALGRTLMSRASDPTSWSDTLIDARYKIEAEWIPRQASATMTVTSERTATLGRVETACVTARGPAVAVAEGLVAEIRERLVEPCRHALTRVQGPALPRDTDLTIPARELGHAFRTATVRFTPS